jgi:tungstate transport system substrate-binding protein
MTTSILSFCWLRPRNAYTLTDRATWANFKNCQDVEILAEDDPALFNPYGSILVNSANDAITSYRIDGEQLFFPPRPTDSR